VSTRARALIRLRLAGIRLRRICEARFQPTNLG
jgi:hypothetical protein